MSNARMLAAARPQAEDELVAAFQRLVGEIFRVNGELLRTAAQLAGDLGITPARWQVIAVIRNQPMTAAQIGRQLGLSRQAVQQTLCALKQQSLVDALPNPEHRRASLIALSAAGQQVMAELRRRQVALTARFTEALGLSATDINVLQAQLQRMREAAESSEYPQVQPMRRLRRKIA